MKRKSSTALANPRRKRVKGKGDYSQETLAITQPLPRLEAKVDHIEKMFSKMNKPGTLSANIGRSLGSFVGQPDLGSSLGELAGKGISRWLGKGDYKLKHNSLILGDPKALSGAKFSSSGKRGTRIIEREFITDVFASPTLLGGSTAFLNQSYSINPLNRTTFPWLSTIAMQYDQWEPDGIIFEFVSSSSEYNGTSQALGTIVMATDYDVSDPPYATKQQAENSDYACSSKPSEGLLHGIECDPSERPTKLLYTSNPEQSLTNLANFQISTIGCSVPSVKLGELWISYDITFYKKQLASPLSTSYWYEGTCPSVASGVGYFANIAPFNANVPPNIFITQNVGVGSVINFPVNQASGTYLIVYEVIATSTTNIATQTPTNCAILSTRSGVNPAGWSVVYFVVQITNYKAILTGGLTTSVNPQTTLRITEVTDYFT